MNRVILIGELTREALERDTDHGTVNGFSMKTVERFKDREKTAYHDVSAWGEKGDPIKGVPNGSKILVEGKLVYRPREIGDQKVWVASITADVIDVLAQPASETKGSKDDIPF